MASTSIINKCYKTFILENVSQIHIFSVVLLNCHILHYIAAFTVILAENNKQFAFEVLKSEVVYFNISSCGLNVIFIGANTSLKMHVRYTFFLFIKSTSKNN